MADHSKIEWTDATWNPIVGCTIVSPGCTNCYAMRMAARLERMHAKTIPPGCASQYAGTTKPSKAGPVWTGKIAAAPRRKFDEPLRRRKPTTYFVNSMGDLFHEDVPVAWIDQVFARMALAPQHTFQVLTKRSKWMRDYLASRSVPDERGHPAEEIRVAMTALVGTPSRRAAAPSLLAIPLGKYCASIPWPLPNVWLGVSTEDQTRADERIPDLLATPAAVRFVSAEPLLGPIDLRNVPYPSPPEDPGRRGSALDGHEVAGMVGNCIAWIPPLDWVIVGGESGPGARPMHPDWARSLRDQCAAAGVAFHFKQWGEWRAAADLSSEEAESLELQNRYHHLEAVNGWCDMVRLGKKAAGRVLDGRTHDQLPEVAHV